MAELERLANHFGDIGAICNDASFSIMHAHCGILRERTLRAAEACFGHRLMMDRVVPGGVATDLAAGGIDRSCAACSTEIRQRFPRAGRALRQYRLAAGPHRHHRHSSARRWRGNSARAAMSAAPRAAPSMRGAAPGYPPYDDLTFDVPVLRGRRRQCPRLGPHSRGRAEPVADRSDPRRGCRTARSRTRGRPPARRACEGLALVEGFRGDVLVWLRIDGDGTIERCHLRDPSWFQWPLLEAVIEGNIVADFPLCNKSFNCSYSGHDL